MRRTQFIKFFCSRIRIYVHIVKESIAWISKRDFFAVTLRSGDCTVGVIGRQVVISDLQQIFNTDELVSVLGPIRRWNSLKQSKKFGIVDVLLRENPPWTIDGDASQFFHPANVGQRIKLDLDFDAFFSSINHSQRQRFMESVATGDTVALGHSPEEIETFYTQFLLPDASSMGSLNPLPPLQSFLDFATKNCLLHIKDDSGVIQMTIFILKEKFADWHIVRIGINSHFRFDKHRNEVLQARCYVELVKYAMANGQKNLGLGFSPAVASNENFVLKNYLASQSSYDLLAYRPLQGSAQTALGLETLTALKLIIRTCDNPGKVQPGGKAQTFGPDTSSEANSGYESNSKIVSTFFHMGIASAVTSVLGLALKIILPRTLGTTQMAQIYFAESVAAIFFGFMPLGIASYISREVAKNPEQSSMILSTVIPFQLLMAVILTFIMFAFLKISGADSIGQHCGFAFAIFSAAMILQKNIVGRTYIALGKSGVIAANEIWTRLILVCIVATVLVWKPSSVNVAWSYATAHIIGISLLIRKSHADRIMRWTTDYSRFKEIVWTSLPFFAVSVLIEIYANVDIAMLSFFSNGDEVAYYGSANKLKGAALVFLPIFQAAVQPALARAWFNHRENFGPLVSQAMRIVVALSLPIVMIMVVVPDYLATLLFGPQFAKASIAIACVAPILTLSSLNVLMGSCLNVVSNGVSFLTVTLISVLMNAILNATAISYAVREFGPGAGAAAAAIATVISETFVLVAMRRIFKVGLDQRRLWLILSAAILPCLVIGSNFQALQAINPLYRIGAAVLLVPIYMYLVRLLRPEDIRWITQIRNHLAD